MEKWSVTPLATQNVATTFTGIAVVNNDVYICGSEYIEGTPYSTHIAKYWKNGKLMSTSNLSGRLENKAFDIGVIGGDVYMVGTAYPDAIVWKNGIPTILEGRKGIQAASRIVVNGNDFHVVGNDAIGPYSSQGRYWKNGVLTEVPGLTELYSATGLAVHGSMLHIVGFNYKLNGVTSNITIAQHLKNGQLIPISNNVVGFGRYGTSVSVTNDSEYILTNEFGNNYPYRSVLTKNGNAITPYYGEGVTGSISGIVINYY